MADRYLLANKPESSRVPELTAKKAATQSALKTKKIEAIAKKKATVSARRNALQQRTEKYNEEYKAEQSRLIELRREAKSTGNFYVEPEAKLLFVIRLAGINKLAPKPRKILQLLRLRQINNGVFMKVNAATMQMLRYVAPYVTFGYPSLKTVKQLVYKRGFGKVRRQRIPLSDNQVISKELGQTCGIHGVEDLVHEIYTVGPNFKQANNFLWPFKLSTPTGGWIRKRHGFNEARGGDWGNREQLINQLVRKMN